MKFMFVNKDPTSANLSRSETTEQVQINRHAQRIQYAKREESRSTFVVTKLHNESSTNRNLKHVPPWSKPTFVRQAGSNPPPSQRRVDSSEETHPPVQHQIDPTDLKVIWSATTDPYANLGNSWDPFVITNIPRDPWAYLAIDYYARISGLALFKPEVQAQGNQQRYDNALWCLVRDALYEPVQFYALVACAVGWIQEVSRHTVFQPYGKVPRIEWVLQQAMHWLRATIAAEAKQGKLTARTVINIHQLAYATMFVRDYEASRIHMKTFRELAPLVKGDSVYHSYLRDDFALGDIHLAAKLMVAPQYPVLCDGFPDEVYQQILPTVPASARLLGSRLLQIIPEFDLVTVKIIQDLVQWLQLRDKTVIRPKEHQPDAKWIRDRGNNLLSRLLSLDPFQNSELSSHEQKVVELIRMACTILMLSLVTHVATSRTRQLAFSKLRAALALVFPALEDDDRIPANIESTEIDLFIWSLFTVFHVLTVCKDDTKWYEELLRHGLKQRQIVNVEGLQDLVTQFLYVPENQRNALTLLMEPSDQTAIKSSRPATIED